MRAVPTALQLEDIDKPIYALAKVFAQIDGKLGRFLAEEDGMLTFTDTGTYEGYFLKAEKLLEKLAVAGWEFTEIKQGD